MKTLFILILIFAYTPAYAQSASGATSSASGTKSFPALKSLKSARQVETQAAYLVDRLKLEKDNKAKLEWLSAFRTLVTAVPPKSLASEMEHWQDGFRWVFDLYLEENQPLSQEDCPRLMQTLEVFYLGSAPEGTKLPKHGVWVKYTLEALLNCPKPESL